MTKRVALLAYYFPPLGGAGVQRAVTLARHLPEFGWDPVVVTGPGSQEDRWSPRDAGLGRGLEGVRVVHVAGPEPPRRGGRAERWLRVRSEWARWWEQAAVDALETLDVDLVLATLSPFEGATAAARAAATLGKPWVADLRDPWALDEMAVYPSRLHRAAERREMRTALATASAIVMNTAEARRATLEAFPALEPRLTAPVPNGYDPGDFAGDPTPRADQAFRIVHTGYLHTELAQGGPRDVVRSLAGGTLNGVQIGARSHLYLLQAIDRLRAEEPALGERIELHLAGVLSQSDVESSDRPYVKRLGYLSHTKTVALMRSADALFLPMHDLGAGRRARIVPGKTYEYLGAGRPILAAVPEGDARDLLERAGNAAVCGPRDVDALVDALRGLVHGRYPAEPLPTVVAPFDRRLLTGRLAAILDRVARVERAATAA
jgi:glycosyltransferase involved in cell wall biosynthesis